MISMISKLLTHLELEYYGKGALIIYFSANITIEEYYFS